MKIRDEALKMQVQTDVHAPAEVRATPPIRRMDRFLGTIGTQPGDEMYLVPGDRLVIR